MVTNEKPIHRRKVKTLHAVLRQETSDTRQEDKEHKAAIVRVRSNRVLAYPLTSVPLAFAPIDGLKISTDNSFQLAPRNIDACINDGMFLVHSHID